jgi:hypothetical protein
MKLFLFVFLSIVIGVSTLFADHPTKAAVEAYKQQLVDLSIQTKFDKLMADADSGNCPLSYTELKDMVVSEGNLSGLKAKIVNYLKGKKTFTIMTEVLIKQFPSFEKDPKTRLADLLGIFSEKATNPNTRINAIRKIASDSMENNFTTLKDLMENANLDAESKRFVCDGIRTYIADKQPINFDWIKNFVDQNLALPNFPLKSLDLLVLTDKQKANAFLFPLMEKDFGKSDTLKGHIMRSLLLSVDGYKGIQSNPSTVIKAVDYAYGKRLFIEFQFGFFPHGYVERKDLADQLHGNFGNLSKSMDQMTLSKMLIMVRLNRENSNLPSELVAYFQAMLASDNPKMRRLAYEGINIYSGDLREKFQMIHSFAKKEQDKDCRTFLSKNYSPEIFVQANPPILQTIR